MQNCLEPLGRDSIEFSAVQCYLKGIKTTLDRVFSYAMLSGALQATLHRVLTFFIRVHGVIITYSLLVYF